MTRPTRWRCPHCSRSSAPSRRRGWESACPLVSPRRCRACGIRFQVYPVARCALSALAMLAATAVTLLLTGR
jgi:hypothetical protein